MINKNILKETIESEWQKHLISCTGLTYEETFKRGFISGAMVDIEDWEFLKDDILGELI